MQTNTEAKMVFQKGVRQRHVVDFCQRFVYYRVSTLSSFVHKQKRERFETWCQDATVLKGKEQAVEWFRKESTPEPDVKVVYWIYLTKEASAMHNLFPPVQLGIIQAETSEGFLLRFFEEEEYNQKLMKKAHWIRKEAMRLEVCED